MSEQKYASWNPWHGCTKYSEGCRYCKALGIRLSGPPLGRKRAGEAGARKTRQMRKDACERNGIESSNGVAKRRYGLDLIIQKNCSDNK